MSPKSVMTELRKTSRTDLVRDVSAKRMQIAKMRLGITMQKEKDSAKYRREKKELARMLTALRDMPMEAIESKKKSKKSTSSKK